MTWVLGEGSKGAGCPITEIGQVGTELLGTVSSFISTVSPDLLKNLSEHFLDVIKQNKINSGK